ncbi:SusC/RagA family TonB-linked outer membrane protein [Chitinophaga nivalis]|uniref:SusC/RagA family TonB-linked outer membrane protein n=1 Tax=Chitinophaga nivalis TaxID=2991709 RepID=A0ABT3ITG4_9BACT|nr:SusC/RagA family TonB-linked outer membrane protein [Chitinophaga nivalis]MCW3463031.1 SusC/RagA family TonB-linked outer membrane protein [Chitinophaga nivalis]MCW3487279.1 SusC/RagA family TonB-linked outer membrane protein [Chitinophaga nivalis]
MKFTALLMMICLQLTVNGFSQVTISKKRTTLLQVFREIRKQTGYVFVYNNDMLPADKFFDIDVVNKPVTTVLRECLAGSGLTYGIQDNHTIVIKRTSRQATTEEDTPPVLLRGRITDKNGQPLYGASVVVKGTSIGVATMPDGSFSLHIPDDKKSVVVTFVGFKPLELKVGKEPFQVIQLERAAVEIKHVEVSTGMFNRNKLTFSGAIATFTGKELRQIGNLNALESLKTLDPSFIIAPNNVMGSNPNQLPNIEVRGKTSLSSSTVRDQFSNDPNQPLFILNGMEATLRQIVDLDINRVASITLLKDAASTALYGSRAANGVVVVETIQPKPGELRVSYTADLRWEIPDLRDYNMMDAAENLEFQRLAGLYKVDNQTSPIANDNLYNERLAAVRSGVNSYWLNVPLRNSFTSGHSVRASGGSAEFQYGIGLNYRNLSGVMIGSDRSTWGGTVDLTYRKKKLNISNQLYVNGSNANESPYGSFKDFVNINPYYQKKRADGSVNTDRYLETYLINRNSFMPDTIKVGNPLYNANLHAKNNLNLLEIQNNLSFIYDLTPVWRISGGLQVNKGVTKGINFIPAANTQFDTVSLFRKGKYTDTRVDNMSYQANLMVTYRKVFHEVHSLTGNVRSEIQEQSQTVSAYTATGFPEGVNPNPAFAYGFLQDSKPEYHKTTIRKVNALGSINYAYDNRYFVDVNFRIDGSTSFGTENKYTPFWAIGAGWNLSSEKMLAAVTWLNMLRIRGNIGTTGNQALGSYASTSVYGYENNLSIFGQGLYMTQLGNPLLEWQKTQTISVGLDAALWNNRLTATINAYEKLSKPLIANGSLPASSGVSTYTLNVGNLRTRGVEAIVRYSPIYRPDKNLLWTIGYTGSLYKSRYEGFSNILKNLNDAAQKSNSLQRYLDGYSPDEIWAVASLGIDPATGKEVFRKKNGEKTLVYDPTDIIPIGNGRPAIEGVISSNLNIKGWLLGINLRYSVGAYIFNTALYNKVENISYAGLKNNQDKRALELRWKQPGDEAQFKGISIAETTPLSSRFIQQENFLTGESINVGYEFRSYNYRWLKQLRLQSIRVNGYMNNIFRLSNIRSERGIDYPFSNAVSFSVNVFF